MIFNLYLNTNFSESELASSHEQWLHYLKSIQAEDLLRIEKTFWAVRGSASLGMCQLREVSFKGP